MYVSWNVYCIQLTDAGIMVLDIQKISTATAVIAAPSILAATFRTLAGFFLFALINVCTDKTNVQLLNSAIHFFIVENMH